MSADTDLRPPSYQKINYALRPAKAIERRMLCDVFSRLYPFQSVHSFGYVGFGSVYFSDFYLLHRFLGITKLVSIERDVDNAQRFRNNIPFGCIELRFCHSSVALPELDWTQRQIVWLDYDNGLELDVLADIATVVSKAVSGSFMVVSVNAHPVNEPAMEQRNAIERRNELPFSLPDYRLEQLKNALAEKVPRTVEGRQLNGEGLANVLRQIILNEIESALAIRNAILPAEEKYSFRQIVHFHYRDGARMLTVGGILYQLKDLDTLNSCCFDELPFVRQEDSAFGIVVPCLTPNELRYLNATLPVAGGAELEARGIPISDIEHYKNLYRYFPAFTEVLFQ